MGTKETRLAGLTACWLRPINELDSQLYYVSIDIRPRWVKSDSRPASWKRSDSESHQCERDTTLFFLCTYCWWWIVQSNFYKTLQAFIHSFIIFQFKFSDLLQFCPRKNSLTLDTPQNIFDSNKSKAPYLLLPRLRSHPPNSHNPPALPEIITVHWYYTE